ncbi:MAG: hypothetical protein Q7S34_00955 [bacterium]|nr:hypothetical protein [bacterium]
MNHAKFKPLIEAIYDPSLEGVDGLDNLTTNEIVEYTTKYMPDDIFLGLLMKNQKGHYGFVLNPRAFGIQKSVQRQAEVMSALLNRFEEVRKNNSDWEKYAGLLRNKSE